MSGKKFKVKFKKRNENKILKSKKGKEGKESIEEKDG